jgi:PhnB protein
MQMQVQPYLFFEGRCEEALAFYSKALGAKVEMQMKYSECPEPPHPGMPAGFEKKIMHSAFKIGNTTVMGSDGMCSGQPGFKGFSLALDAKDEAEAKRLFSALGEGGQVQQPLTKTFFSPAFGMVTDKFGVGWMVMVAA